MTISLSHYSARRRLKTATWGWGEGGRNWMIWDLKAEKGRESLIMSKYVAHIWLVWQLNMVIYIKCLVARTVWVLNHYAGYTQRTCGWMHKSLTPHGVDWQSRTGGRHVNRSITEWGPMCAIGDVLQWPGTPENQTDNNARGRPKVDLWGMGEKGTGWPGTWGQGKPHNAEVHSTQPTRA